MGVIEDVVAAIKAGQPAILPTDTVYGLAADAYREAPTRRVYELKGRPASQPSALVAAEVEMLFECVPELRGRSGTIVRALLPGPYTLVLPNPAGRFRWLTGDSPHTIGVRVPELPEPARRIVEEAGAIVATSANLPGGPDPRRVEDIPEAILERVAVVVDAGELPGIASTVIDFSGAEPRVLREGAASSAAAIARVSAALA